MRVKVIVFALLLLGGSNFAFAQVSTQCVTTAVAGGTSDAITIPKLPCVDTTTLLILTTTAANVTTTPTIMPVGGVAQTIVSATGAPLHAGALGPGYRTLLTNDGSHWVALNAAASGVFGASPSIVGNVPIWENTLGTLLGSSTIFDLDGVTFIGNVASLSTGTMGFQVRDIPFSLPTIIPVGNNFPTLAGLSYQVSSTGNASVRRFATTLGLTANGTAGSGGTEGSATLYTGIECSGSAGFCWSQNPLINLLPGYTGPGGYISEFDASNLTGTDFVNGSGQFLDGLLVVSGGTNHPTVGISISSVSAPTSWRVGLALSSLCCTDEDIYDNGLGAIGLLINGTHSNAAIVVNGAAPDVFVVGPNDHVFIGDGASQELTYALQMSTNLQRVALFQSVDVVGGDYGFIGVGNRRSSASSFGSIVDFGVNANGNALIYNRTPLTAGIVTFQVVDNNNNNDLVSTINGSLAIGTAPVPVGSGIMSALSYDVGGSGVPGANCSGAPTGLFTSTGGIVTHC